MTRLGLAIPFSNTVHFADHLKLAQEAEARGYDTVWTGEVGGPDAVTTMTLLATNTKRVTIATGIIPPDRTEQVPVAYAR